MIYVGHHPAGTLWRVVVHGIARFSPRACPAARRGTDLCQFTSDTGSRFEERGEFMSAQRFSVGKQFQWQGETYEVKRLLSNDNLNVSSVRTGKVQTVAFPQLINALLAGELYFMMAMGTRPCVAMTLGHLVGGVSQSPVDATLVP